VTKAQLVGLQVQTEYVINPRMYLEPHGAH
jgi:hypothetical protein